MSYGIEVLDSDGSTVFNSTNYVEMASYYATVASGGTFYTPSWCTGGDKTYEGTSYSRTNSTSLTLAYTNNEMAFPQESPEVILTGHKMVVGGVDYFVTGKTGSYQGLTYFSFDKSVAGIRGTSAARTFYEMEYYIARPVFYVRPLSASYSGVFAIVGGGESFTLLDYASGTNTFEVLVANSAEEWGSISDARPSKFLAGTTDYGLQGHTTLSYRYTPSQPLTSFTTYDSRTRPVKVILAKGWAGGTAGTASTFSLGSLSTSTTKRWCRMNSTVLAKIIGNQNYWTAKYNWVSNNNISLSWTSGGGNFSLSTTYTTKAAFAVVEFGDGL